MKNPAVWQWQMEQMIEMKNEQKKSVLELQREKLKAIDLE